MELRQDGYQDMLRRAELFSYIADLVRAQDDPATPPPDASDVKLTLLPKIHVFGQGVVCNGTRLDLTRRPLSLKLFQIFCEKDDMKLSRQDLVEGIYDLKGKPLVSERHREALYVNVVKLVSRTRLLASAYLGRGAGHGIEWFGYDAETKQWSLYRLRSEYLGRRDH
jgi:hypothetical protein